MALEPCLGSLIGHLVIKCYIIWNWWDRMGMYGTWLVCLALMTIDDEMSAWWLIFKNW